METTIATTAGPKPARAPRPQMMAKLSANGVGWSAGVLTVIRVARIGSTTAQAYATTRQIRGAPAVRSGPNISSSFPQLESESKFCADGVGDGVGVVAHEGFGFSLDHDT